MSAPTRGCLDCGRDNDNGTHTALEQTGHLAHSYRPRGELEGLIADQRAWSLETFGPGPRTEGILAHIRKELDEVAADPDNVEEWIDVVILALDGAWRAGGSGKGRTPADVVEALNRKYAVNRDRAWPDWRTASPDQPIEHVRKDIA